MKKLFLTLAVLIALPLFALADIAPAEQISYTFKFSGMKPLKILPYQSEQLQCSDNQCLEPKPLGHFGIQELECDDVSCFAISYELSPYQKLIVKFEDGSVRESEVFKKPSGRKNAMVVTVTPGGLEVKPEKVNIVPDKLPEYYMISSLIFVFLAEILAVAIFIYMNKLPPGIIICYAVLNLITIPLNWLVLSNYIQSDGILWAAAFLLEYGILWLIYRKKAAAADIFGLTLFANVAGYSSGMILSFITTFF